MLGNLTRSLSPLRLCMAVVVVSSERVAYALREENMHLAAFRLQHWHKHVHPYLAV